jgi:RNA polymerase sigma factor (sigma-70 family)
MDALFRLGAVGGIGDGQLLERFAARCDRDGQVAFEAIVKRHGPMVLGVCRRVLGDDHAAEDAFQATFLVLALRAHAVRKRDSLGSWLHGVAQRIAHRLVLLGRRRREEPLPACGLIDRSAGDPALFELNAVLDEELFHLPEKYRLPVIICYLEGQTQEEAARILGWSKGTVSGRLARAKDLLRSRLVRRGLAPSAGALASALLADSASAAVPASLFPRVVQTAMAALFGGADAGVVAGPPAALARSALAAMLVVRLVRAAAVGLLLAVGAAAAVTFARPIFMSAGRPAAVRERGIVRVQKPDRAAVQTDLYGDSLPPRVLMRLGTTRRRHTRAVVKVDFTRAGDAVSAQADGLVRFFNSRSGRQITAADLLSSAGSDDRSLKCFAVSPDGRLLAGGGFSLDPERRLLLQRVWIWDVAAQRLVRTLEPKTLELDSLAFSPDGATLATGAYGGEVKLWSVATGRCQSTLKLGGNPVRTLVYSPDGAALATCEQRIGVRIRELASGLESVLADADCGSFAPSFSPDGRFIAYTRIVGDAVICDRASGSTRFTARGVATGFSPDSRSLALIDYYLGTLKAVDTETGDERWRCDLGWGLKAAGSAFSPDGRTIIAERGGVLRFFEADTGREPLATPLAHQGAVSVVRYTPDGDAIVSGGDDGTARVWSAASAEQLRVFAHRGRISALAVSPDGSALATATQAPDEVVCIWDLAGGQLRRQWTETGKSGSAGAGAAAFSHDGERLLTFGRDGVLKVRDVATGRERPAVQPRFSIPRGDDLETWFSHCEFAPGNKLLGVSTLLAVHVVELATGAELFATPGLAFAFARNGETLAVATPALAYEGTLVDKSGRLAGTVADGIDLINVRLGWRKRIQVPTDMVFALAFSPDGQILAVEGGWRKHVIHLYHTENGRMIDNFSGPAQLTHRQGLVFSPDGARLAAGLDDTSVLIWNVRHDR